MEHLSEKTGSIAGIRATTFLAREIMFTGKTLATTLDELHPSSVIFRATAERIVRRLVVLEESIEVEEDQVRKCNMKKMVFLGIGGGVLLYTVTYL